MSNVMTHKNIPRCHISSSHQFHFIISLCLIFILRIAKLIGPAYQLLSIMSFGTYIFCSVCAVIDFHKLLYHECNESVLGYKDLCLGTLEQVLERAENCNICKLVIDVYKERFRRAPHGRSLDIYNRNSLYPIRSRCINELHEEVKKYGLRLTENGRPIRCNLKEIPFARTNIR